MGPGIARYITLVYAGSGYKCPGRVEFMTWERTIKTAMSMAKLNPRMAGHYVEVWDLKMNQIVWTE